MIVSEGNIFFFVVSSRPMRAKEEVKTRASVFLLDAKMRFYFGNLTGSEATRWLVSIVSFFFQFWAALSGVVCTAGEGFYFESD